MYSEINFQNANLIYQASYVDQNDIKRSIHTLEDGGSGVQSCDIEHVIFIIK